MTTQYQAALETLRRIQQAFRRGVPAEERHGWLRLHDQALSLLEAGTRHRPATLDLAERIAELEHELADMRPGERAAAIRDRLDLSRARFYRLRSLALK